MLGAPTPCFRGASSAFKFARSIEVVPLLPAALRSAVLLVGNLAEVGLPAFAVLLAIGPPPACGTPRALDAL